MSNDSSPQFAQVLEFFRKQIETRPAYAFAPGLISDPDFFSVSALQTHLSNPLLSPDWVFLKSGSRPIPLQEHYLFKLVHGQNLAFLDKRIINDELSKGAALVLEGIDILDPNLNAFSSQLDDSLPCSLVNCVAFFSQRGTEAYEGHVDQDDVLVIHISGKKLWHIFEPQQRRYAGTDKLSKQQMGRKLKELRVKRGDVLYLRAGVPHVCNTLEDHSLHLAFDLIDSTPNPKQITEEANKRYEYDSADCYVSPEEAMEKFIALVQSTQFKNDLQRATRTVKEDARQFRNTIGRASQVDALSKYINGK